MNFQDALNTAIYGKLNGQTTAGTAVFFLMPPDEHPLPFIVWDYVNEGDTNETPRRAKNIVCFIRAYASTSKAANGIDGEIDGLLHKQGLTISGWNNFDTQRENGFALIETNAAGRKTYMSGAEYRIRADQ